MPVKRFPYRYLALFYALLIFGVSAIPSLSAPPLGIVLEDKIVHFFEFGVFSFLLFLAFYHSGSGFVKKYVFLFSSTAAVIYALSDELHQKFVPGRTCEFLDFVADCLGIALVQMGIWFYLKKRDKKVAAARPNTVAR
jgi:VanZ family protein